MPVVVHRISKEYPKLWPMMYTVITDDVVRRIKNGELEFGFFFYEGNCIADVDYKELTHCPIRIVTAPHIDKEGLNSFIGSREIDESNTAALPTFSKLKNSIRPYA